MGRDEIIIGGKTENKMDEEDTNYRVSVFGVVRRLREQRWGMVHTSVTFVSLLFFMSAQEQYLYLYKYLAKMIDKLFQEQGKLLRSGFKPFRYF